MNKIKSLPDILHHTTGNDSSYCIGCLWHLVLSETQRVVTKTMVTWTTSQPKYKDGNMFFFLNKLKYFK